MLADHRLRLYAMSRDLLGVADMEGRFIELSPSWERMLGYAREELLSQPYISFVHPEDRERTLREAGKLAGDANGSPEFTNRYRCKDGSYRFLEWLSTSDPEAGYIYFSARDVTERVLAENALRASEEKLRAMVEQLQVSAAELLTNNALLEREVTERRAAERSLALKEEAIRQLGTPILRVWEGVLLLPVIGTVDADRARQMMEKLLPAIVASSSAMTILDLTGVAEVDAATGSHLLDIVRAVELLGSRCVISGISPKVARTLVELGVAADRFVTFGALSSALGYVLQGRCGGDAAPRARR